MGTFTTILVSEILRATVRHLNEAPELNPAHPGIVEFRRVLEAEIARLQAGGRHG